MSKSIHVTVKQVTQRNAKSELTPDNPDLIALSEKRRLKQQVRERRAAGQASKRSEIVGPERDPMTIFTLQD